MSEMSHSKIYYTTQSLTIDHTLVTVLVAMDLILNDEPLLPTRGWIMEVEIIAVTAEVRERAFYRITSTR